MTTTAMAIKATTTKTIVVTMAITSAKAWLQLAEHI